MTTPAAERTTPLPVEVAAAGYFALQAVLGVLLWVGVFSTHEVRTWLDLVPARPEVTDAFLPADVIIVVASALAAWALLSGRPWAIVPVVWTAGGIVYPTAYLVGWVATTDGTAEVALGIMVTASVLSSWSAFLVWRARRRA